MVCLCCISAFVFLLIFFSCQEKYIKIKQIEQKRGLACTMSHLCRWRNLRPLCFFYSPNSHMHWNRVAAAGQRREALCYAQLASFFPSRPPLIIHHMNVCKWASPLSFTSTKLITSILTNAAAQCSHTKASWHDFGREWPRRPCLKAGYLIWSWGRS